MRKLLAALVSLAILLAATAATTPGAAAFEGVVNDSGVRVPAAPSLSAPVVKTLRLGQEVDVVTTSGAWYQLPSGGWVHSSLIQPRLCRHAHRRRRLLLELRQDRHAGRLPQLT